MTVTEPEGVGVDGARLRRVVETIRVDTERGRYDGATLIVGRRGKVILHEAIGFADRDAGRKARTDDVYAIMSLTKTLSAALLLARFEAGEIALNTPVAAIIPEYVALGKGGVTVAHVLSHTAGLPVLPPVPPEKYGDLDHCVAALCAAPMVGPPGSAVSYSGWASHYLIAEIVRRLDGGRRPYRKIMEEDLLKPLGMHDTALGLRPDLASRRVPLVLRGAPGGAYSKERVAQIEAVITQEHAELPSAGCFSTAADYHRFVQMLASGGILDGTRILSPATIAYAASNHTGTMVNDYLAGMRVQQGWGTWPAYIGLGFILRGEGLFPTNFGLLNSPRAYGHAGAGSTFFWVNPDLDITFVMLTAGWLDEAGTTARFQRLGDMVLSSVTEL